MINYRKKMGEMKKFTLLALGMITGLSVQAQLSSNPDKFLGNITTSYNVDYGAEKYYTLWNQITCENESKWVSIEGYNNNFNWSGSDRAFNYAKDHNFPFKFHALVWGAQYPSWLESQTPEQRYKEIVQWMDAVKAHYPDLQLIDVVNEAIDGHQKGTKYFIEALGGAGVTGYDWIIKAFELAYERWPNAILIYNDFNTFQWNTDQYLDIVKTLRNAGAPIDAYGCQSHDLTDCSFENFKNSMTKLQNALKMPMYSTEYDIGTSNDDLQLQRYKEQIPYMWEKDYVAGVTLWGYIYGKTWTTDGNSGIIKAGQDRPAMTWLREYMKSDKAKNAKSPFPGMKKEASVYIKPSALNIEKGTEASITVRAKMRSKTIEKIDLYANNELVTTMSEEPYVASYTPTIIGSVELKAIVTTTDGSTYTRYSTINAYNPRSPFKGNPIELPGVLEAEDFDKGAEGIAFHDLNSSKQGNASSYRPDVTGIDIENGGSGKVVGYTEVGEWMEYTVDVKEAGLYSYDIYYSTPGESPALSMAISTPEGLTMLTPEKLVLKKTGDWTTYRTSHGRMLIPLEAGQQRLRIGIAGGTGQYVINLDRITFKRVDINKGINISLDNAPRTAPLGKATPITAEISSESEIKNVKFYIDGFLAKPVNNAPYTYNYTPSTKGTYRIMAIATDVNDMQSEIASYDINVIAQRTPFKEIEIPGIVEAEDFDCGEEGMSFHDSDLIDDGKTSYRKDNEGVDIFRGNGGYVIGNTVADEWLEYTVNVKEAGKYICNSTVSAGASAMFTINDVTDGNLNTLWTVRVAKTGDKTGDVYKVINSSSEKVFNAGIHVIRLYIKSGSCYIDKFELTQITDGIENIAEVSDCTYLIYNLSGTCVGRLRANGSRDLQHKILDLTGKDGVYIIKNTLNGTTSKIMTK